MTTAKRRVKSKSKKSSKKSVKKTNSKKLVNRKSSKKSVKKTNKQKIVKKSLIKKKTTKKTRTVSSHSKKKTTKKAIKKTTKTRSNKATNVQKPKNSSKVSNKKITKKPVKKNISKSKKIFKSKIKKTTKLKKSPKPVKKTVSKKELLAKELKKELEAAKLRRKQLEEVSFNLLRKHSVKQIIKEEIKHEFNILKQEVKKDYEIFKEELIKDSKIVKKEINSAVDYMRFAAKKVNEKILQPSKKSISKWLLNKSIEMEINKGAKNLAYAVKHFQNKLKENNFILSDELKLEFREIMLSLDYEVQYDIEDNNHFECRSFLITYRNLAKLIKDQRSLNQIKRLITFVEYDLLSRANKGVFKYKNKILVVGEFRTKFIEKIQEKSLEKSNEVLTDFILENTKRKKVNIKESQVLTTMQLNDQAYKYLVVVSKVIDNNFTHKLIENNLKEINLKENLDDL